MTYGCDFGFLGFYSVFERLDVSIPLNTEDIQLCALQLVYFSGDHESSKCNANFL